MIALHIAIFIASIFFWILFTNYWFSGVFKVPPEWHTPIHKWAHSTFSEPTSVSISNAVIYASGFTVQFPQYLSFFMLFLLVLHVLNVRPFGWPCYGILFSIFVVMTQLISFIFVQPEPFGWAFYGTIIVMVLTFFIAAWCGHHLTRLGCGSKKLRIFVRN